MEDLVKLSDIRKSYPGKEVLSGVSLAIKQGSVHGFLGPNGAGKSTLMNIILNELESDSGSIKRCEDLSIGYLPENPPLYLDMKTVDYLSFVQKIYDKSDNTYLDYVIDVCGLNEVKDRMIGHLSKGFKQRVGIAQAICHNPSLLVLDEPMVGLDPHAVSLMKDLILKLSKDHTIFISSHQLHELSQVCSYVSILHHGRIIKDGTIAEIEKGLQKEQAVDVELSEDARESVTEFSTRYNCTFLEKSPLVYRFTSSSDEDLRLILSKFFIEKNISILAMNAVKMDLEEIFKVVTKEDS